MILSKKDYFSDGSTITIGRPSLIHNRSQPRKNPSFRFLPKSGRGMAFNFSEQEAHRISSTLHSGEGEEQHESSESHLFIIN